MARVKQDLRGSGILDQIPKVGEPIPPFELPGTDGGVIRMQDLLSQGPLVISVYRGLW